MNKLAIDAVAISKCTKTHIFHVNSTFYDQINFGLSWSLNQFIVCIQFCSCESFQVERNRYHANYFWFFFLVSTIKLNLMFIQNRFFFFILTFLFFFAVLHIYITINGIYIWTQKHEMINEANVIESMQFNTTKLSKTEELNYR